MGLVTIVYDKDSIFDDKEKYLLEQSKILPISDLKFLKSKNMSACKMVIFINGRSSLLESEKVFIKKFERISIPFIQISKVTRNDISELICNISNFRDSFKNLTKTNNDNLLKALVYIENNLHDNNLNLSSVSSHLYLNRIYFSRFFRETMGVGFREYITKLRISKSKELLKIGYLVTDVCLAVGYTNLSYFSQLFKKMVGVSPSVYRKNNYFLHKEENNVQEIL